MLVWNALVTSTIIHAAIMESEISVYMPLSVRCAPANIITAPEQIKYFFPLRNSPFDWFSGRALVL